MFVEDNSGQTLPELTFTDQVKMFSPYKGVVNFGVYSFSVLMNKVYVSPTEVIKSVQMPIIPTNNEVMV